MKNNYNSYADIQYLSDIVSNPLIEVGKYSYYSGYYTEQDFENGCVRYLWGDETTKDLFNPERDFGWKVDKLIIGNYVCIASGAIILMGGNHNHHSDWITVYPFESHIQKSYKSCGDTHIKGDAWIGMNAIIMPGVTIHEGAIIASGAVVSKDVDAYTIVGGNPAKVIKKRFNDDDINKLLEMKWWDWSEKQLESAKDFLMSSDINGLYTYYKSNIHDIL